jgi:hypothetical protein
MITTVDAETPLPLGSPTARKDSDCQLYQACFHIYIHAYILI